MAMWDQIRRLSGGSGGAAAAPSSKSAPPSAADRAEAKYREAKALADAGRWGPALHALNGTLVLQRSALGEDHPDAGRTLNDIGVTLMNLGRYYPAQTALKEAQYIREEALGPGAPEVAETLTNMAILMDKVNTAEAEAHDREEKREIVRRKSFGSMDGLAAAAGLADFDFEDEDGGSLSEEEEDPDLILEAQRLEEQREQMRLVSMKMAASRRQMSMEHIQRQQRKSGGSIALGISMEALETEQVKRRSGGGLAAGMGMNAMDAARVAAGDDEPIHRHQRGSCGSLSGLSVDAALDAALAAACFDSDSDSDEDDPPPKPRRRRSGSILGFGGDAGEPAAWSDSGGERQTKLPRPRSFDHLSIGASLGAVDLREQIRQEHKPKKRLSGGILSSAISSFQSEVVVDSDDEPKGKSTVSAKSFGQLSMNKPQLDLREQIRQEHNRPKRRISNGIYKSFNKSDDDLEVDTADLRELMRESMVFSKS